MGWIESKAIRLLRPEFADVFVRGESLKGLETFGKVISSNEVCEVSSKLIVTVVVVALYGGFFDGAIHALHLTVGPGMVGLGEAMMNVMTMADPVEGMSTQPSGWPLAILGQVSELDAVVGEHGVDAIGNGLHQCLEEGSRRLHVGPLDQFDEGKL